MNAVESTLWQRLRTTRLRDVLRGRIDGRLDWRRVIAQADLPAEISSAIEQVVRRSRLWRSERVDVAQELIAHFQDGLDAGRTPRQLVDSFGDPAQAAALIRRAKKRGRSLGWQIWGWGCWAAGIWLVLYIGTAAYFLMGRPSITTDYLAIVNERALSVPEAERAWPLYREALAKMDYLNPPPKWMTSDLGPGDENWPAAATWFSEHADDLALIREGARRPEMGLPVHASFEAYPLEDRRVFYSLDHEILKQPEVKEAALEDRWLISTLLPQVQSLREIARLLAADARRAAAAGNGRTAYADIDAILEMSHHCEEQPFLVNGLVAAAVQGLAFTTIEEVFVDKPGLWSDDQMRDLGHRIAAAEVDWHRSFQGERFSFYDAVQRLYTDNGRGDGRITGNGLLGIGPMVDILAPQRKHETGFWQENLKDLAINVAGPVSLYLMATRGNLLEEYDRLMDQQEAAFDKSLWETGPSAWEQSINRWSKLERLRYLPITVLLSNLSSVRNSIESYRGERDGVSVGIALELYHRAHGTWPEALAELSPGYLPQVPIDRLNGKPLYYLLVGDRPMIYSVGVDGDDDGGRAAEDDEGKLDRQLAGPRSFDADETASPDGDWVIWSAVRKEPGARSEEPGERD